MEPASAGTRVATGIAWLGAVPWGTHLCSFFGSSEELRHALIPYVRVGLEAGDQCVWVVSNPRRADDARRALAAGAPDVADRERSGQLEIATADDVYGDPGGFRTEDAIRGWLDREDAARAQGFTGLRVAVVAPRLRRETFAMFQAYEAAVNDAIRGRRILGLCAYPLPHAVEDAVAVMTLHHSSLLVRGDGCDIVSSATQVAGALDEPRPAPWEHLAARGAHTDANVDAGLAGAARTRSEVPRRPPRHRGAHRSAERAIAALQRVTAALSEVRSPDDIQAIIERDIGPAVGACRTVIAAADGESGALDRLCAVGISSAIPDRFATSAVSDSAPPSEAFRTGIPRWLPDADAIRRHYPGLGSEAHAWAVIPLTVAGGALGVIEFGFSEPQDFEASQRAFIHDVAKQTALALERAQLYAGAERQRRRAESANHAKDNFLVTLGHELRNPLAAIRAALRLLGPLNDADKLRRAQGVLDRQVGQMSKLVDGLLDASRIARDKVALDTAPLELGAAIAETLHDQRPAIESRGLALCTDIGSGLWVDGDRVRLIQVLDNLLSNAIKFTEAPGTVAVSAERDAAWVRLRIADTGMGIAPEHLAHIFEPFRQAPQGLARTAGGLGVGLALVKGLVELHGGHVNALSGGEGAGTQIEVSLPARAPPATSRG